MKKSRKVQQMKNWLWYLTGAFFVLLIVEFTTTSIALFYIADFIILGIIIAVFVLSIKLIRQKQYGMGVTFLVISSIFLLRAFIAFMIGMVAGMTMLDMSGWSVLGGVS